MSRWFTADNPPKEGGYYLTIHYVEDLKQHLWKAFWYRPDQAEWVFRYKPNVKIWFDRPFMNYIPCQHQDDVNPVPEEFFPLIENPPSENEANV